MDRWLMAGGLGVSIIGGAWASLRLGLDAWSVWRERSRRAAQERRAVACQIERLRREVLR